MKRRDPDREANRVVITVGRPVTHAEALRACDDIELALGDVVNSGTRRPGQLPLDAIARLIQYARDNPPLLQVDA